MRVESFNSWSTLPVPFGVQQRCCVYNLALRVVSFVYWKSKIEKKDCVLTINNWDFIYLEVSLDKTITVCPRSLSISLSHSAIYNTVSWVFHFNNNTKGFVCQWFDRNHDFFFPLSLFHSLLYLSLLSPCGSLWKIIFSKVHIVI